MTTRPVQPLLYAESFSPNTAEGACPQCHGLGRMYTVTEESMVPDTSLTIRERAIAAWPTAWGGQNQRDILVSMGFDVDKPWRELPQKDRDWILFSEEQHTVPVYPGFTPAETRKALKQKLEPGYMGTFTSARRHVFSTFANTHSAMMKKRVAQFMISAECDTCHGKRLRPESLSVKFDGYDIAGISALPLKRLHAVLGRSQGIQTGGTPRILKRTKSPAHHRGHPQIDLTCSSTWGSVTSLSIAAHRRFPRANCSGCASRPSCIPISSA